HFSLPLFYLIFLDSSMIFTQKTNADPPQISQFPAGHFGTFVTSPFLWRPDRSAKIRGLSRSRPGSNPALLCHW
ncbi:MAG: hypothetical protein PHQ85_09355, partial [Eubacteriales bacterium]|nr:hypothetical protein [Eubacteriales bacterium]